MENWLLEHEGTHITAEEYSEQQIELRDHERAIRRGSSFEEVRRNRKRRRVGLSRKKRDSSGSSLGSEYGTSSSSEEERYAVSASNSGGSGGQDKRRKYLDAKEKENLERESKRDELDEQDVSENCLLPAR